MNKNVKIAKHFIMLFCLWSKNKPVNKLKILKEKTEHVKKIKRKKNKISNFNDGKCATESDAHIDL